MILNQEKVRKFSEFLAGSQDSEMELDGEIGLIVIRKEGKNYVGFADTDQVFQFTGVYKDTINEEHWMIFQSTDFDIMVPLEDCSALDYKPLDSYKDIEATKRIHITDNEYDWLMEVASTGNESGPDNFAFQFGNGFKIVSDESEDTLSLEGESLYQIYDVTSVFDYGVPYGGAVIGVGQYSFFFRNYEQPRQETL